MKEQLDYNKIAALLGVRSDPQETPLDYDKIAALLGAERRGPVVSGGGYWGALGTAAEVAALSVGR
jgi:hypothetical protein